VKLHVSKVGWAVLPACVLAAIGLTGQAGMAQTTASQAPAAQAGVSAALRLHVSGNKLVNADGHDVVLHGVDYSGAEYECVQNHGFFAGPTDKASVTAMKSWDINAVRLPLNEACWNGEYYVRSAYAGKNYQNAIKAYVNLLNANGIVVILDLHWSDGYDPSDALGCVTSEALCQKPMPDAAESVPFWSSVAKTFKGDDAVLFDLFNEPFPDKVMGSGDSAWACWRNGGSACAGFSYKVAGMQTLVNAVRGTGAKNVIMLGGLNYANNLSGWLKYEPRDPAHNLAASWHSYNFDSCNNQQCWTSQVGPVIAKVPVIAGEIGENDCADHYIDPLMAYLDSKSTSYLAWSWNAYGGCGYAPQLISSYSGTPTAYGAGYKSHLQALARKHASQS
jgi:endoglucanase